jgi:sarcosine oxidase subunit gamma
MHLTREAPLAMLSLRADLNDRSLVEDISRAAITPVPAPMMVSESAEVTLAWMAPDELLILCLAGRKDTLVSSIRGGSDGANLLLTDVSDMRERFALTGGQVREVLARLTPADVSPRALPVGMIRRTRIGQVSAAFWLRGEDEAQLLCFRSVGDYVETLLTTTVAHASPIGLYTQK